MIFNTFVQNTHLGYGIVRLFLSVRLAFDGHGRNNIFSNSTHVPLRQLPSSASTEPFVSKDRQEKSKRVSGFFRGLIRFLRPSEHVEKFSSRWVRLQRRDFEIDSVLGAGEYATVNLARPRNPALFPGAPDHVALKVTRLKEFNMQEVQQAEDERAAHAAASGHAHVATLYGAYLERNVVCMVLEYLRGGTLHDAMLSSGGALPEQRALEICLQLAEALQHIHERGIAHRDIKLENVMLVAPFRPEGPNTVKLIDFGLSHVFDPCDASSRMRRECWGTAAYMMPDAVSFRLHDVTKADVYALGVLLFELIANHNPFEGDESVEDVYYGNMQSQKWQDLEFERYVWRSVQTSTKTLLEMILTHDARQVPTAAEVVTFIEMNCGK